MNQALVAECVGDCATDGYFDRLAGLYAGYRPVDRERTRREVDALPPSRTPGAPGRAVDVMCGPGRHTLELLRRGWWVHGVDVTPAFRQSLVEEARAAGLADRLAVTVGDAYATRLPSGADLGIVLGNSFGFGAGRAECGALLAALRDAVLPGGTVGVETFDLDVRRRAHAEGKRHLLPGGGALTKTFGYDEATSTEHVAVRVDTAAERWRTCYRQYVPDRHELAELFAQAGLEEPTRCAAWPSTDSSLVLARRPAEAEAGAVAASGEPG